MGEDEIATLIEAHGQRGDELLARIDEHLERGVIDTSPEHLARGAELELSLARHLACWEELYSDESATSERWRFEAARDSLRHERALGEVSQSLVRRTHELVRYFVDEGPAHRDALWRISHQLAEDTLGRRWTTAPSYPG